MSPPPRVFVSATSRDLASYRKAVAEVLLTRDWHPVLQDHFAPDYRAVREMLRAKIQTCDAVICLIGWRYGEEPKNRKPSEPRLSYTQLEYEIATELGKPIFRFIATENCPLDNPHDPPEDAERTALQRAYRSQFESSDHLRHSFDSLEMLLQQVRVIQVSRVSKRTIQRAICLALLLLSIPIAYVGLTSYLHRDPCAEPYRTLLTFPEMQLASFLPRESFKETDDKPQEPSNSAPITCHLKVINETGRPIRIWRYFPEPRTTGPEPSASIGVSQAGEMKSGTGTESDDPKRYQAWRAMWVCHETGESPAMNGWSFIYIEDLQWSLREARQDTPFNFWFTPSKKGWVYLPYRQESVIKIKKDFFDDPTEESNFVVRQP